MVWAKSQPLAVPSSRTWWPLAPDVRLPEGDHSNEAHCSCHARLAAGFKVFPPNQTRAKIVPFPVRVCTQIVSLRVGPVRL
jgi:hypothetical protein